jgi:hypothetical protein
MLSSSLPIRVEQGSEERLEQEPDTAVAAIGFRSWNSRQSNSTIKEHYVSIPPGPTILKQGFPFWGSLFYGVVNFAGAFTVSRYVVRPFVLPLLPRLFLPFVSEC